MDFTTDKNGFLGDGNGNTLMPFVDSFSACALDFPEAHIILLRLYDVAKAEQPGPVPLAQAHQVRMSTRTARRLAADLVRLADLMEGETATRQ